MHTIIAKLFDISNFSFLTPSVYLYLLTRVSVWKLHITCDGGFISSLGIGTDAACAITPGGKVCSSSHPCLSIAVRKAQSLAGSGD